MENSAGSGGRVIGRVPRRWRGTTGAGVAGAELGAARAEPSPGRAFGGLTDAFRQAATVRVLIAIEDRHRVYREAIAEFLRASRSHLELRTVSPRALNGELRRFGPQIVVHAGPPVPVPDLLPCWVELSLDPSVATVFRMGRVRREVVNPSARHLLAMIDEAAPACSR